MRFVASHRRVACIHVAHPCLSIKRGQAARLYNPVDLLTFLDGLFDGNRYPGQSSSSFSSFSTRPSGGRWRHSGVRCSRASPGGYARSPCDAFIHWLLCKFSLAFRWNLGLRASEGASASAHRPWGSSGNAPVLLSNCLHSVSRVLRSLASGRYSECSRFEEL